MRKHICLYALPTLLLAMCLARAAADSPATQPDASSTQPATQPTTQPVALNWDQAKAHVGQLATVTGPVVGTHDFGDAAVLNVGKDFPAAGRFTVYIPEDKRKGVPDDLYQGCTLSATGTIKLYHGVPEIEAGAADITVVKKADAAAGQ